jgi:hypothetical protein
MTEEARLAIDFTGHCRHDIAGAQQRIEHLRSVKPDWFVRPLTEAERARLTGPPAWLEGVLLLTDAHPLGPFDHEIAMEFGIDARCSFLMSVLDKERLDEVREAVELVYETFGTAALVVTWGNDTLRPPLRDYEGLKL